jgi:Bacterial Ig-like domain (group 3)/Repeat of unknown function (DUF5648)
VVSGGADQNFVAGFRLARFMLDARTPVTLATGVNPSSVGQSVALSAGIAGPPTAGTMEFRDGSVTIAGCGSVTMATESSKSVARCTFQSNETRVHSITASYSGDALKAAGTSSVLQQVVYAPRDSTMVEYFYPPWNHYFITALPSEIAALDNGAFPGWTRTGLTFDVYPASTPGVLPLCRFFSGSSFAPESSHFYTPYPFECQTVKDTEFSVWSFEGTPDSVALPTYFGVCAPGSRPLYRLFNNGQGGAPNHRYTTNMETQATMIAAGWISEGAGASGVIACVPNQ